MNRIRHFVVLVAVAALAAIGTPARSVGQAGTEVATVNSAPRAVPVHVQNYNLLDVNVYVRVGGQPFRLGTVTSFGTADFVLPAAALNATGVQLIADPIGQASTFATDEFTVVPGQQVDWTIENNLPQSSVWVS